MTRGRESNTAWVVTTPLGSDAQTGETFDVRPRNACGPVPGRPVATGRPYVTSRGSRADVVVELPVPGP